MNKSFYKLKTFDQKSFLTLFEPLRQTSPQVKTIEQFSALFRRAKPFSHPAVFFPRFEKTFLFRFCTIFVSHEPSLRSTQDDSSLKSYLWYELMIKIYNICWFSKRVINRVVLILNCLYVLLLGEETNLKHHSRGEAFGLVFFCKTLEILLTYLATVIGKKKKDNFFYHKQNKLPENYFVAWKRKLNKKILILM